MAILSVIAVTARKIIIEGKAFVIIRAIPVRGSVDAPGFIPMSITSVASKKPNLHYRLYN